MKKIGKENISDLNRYEFKELKSCIGGISQDFQILSELQKSSKDCTSIFSEVHQEAFMAAYNQNSKSLQYENVIRELESINLIDFGGLTWNEILILRKSEFVTDFRTKIFEWTEKYRDESYAKEFQTDLTQFINDSKFDFLKRKKPNLRMTSILGILGNLPLPIPFNPVSIGSSIKNVADDVKTKEQFSWLFFIQKVHEMSSKR